MASNVVTPKAHRLVSILPQTETEWTFRVEHHGPVNHGQFMQLSLPRVGECPISISGFTDDTVDFTIRRVGHVTDELFNLKPGDDLFLRGTYGNGWPYQEIKDKNLVIIAGGTGVSPVKSMINALHDADGDKQVYLILGFKDDHAILFRDELEKWRANPRFHCIYCLDHMSVEGFHEGMVTAFLDQVPFAEFGDDYACVVVGPPVMMRFAGLGLLRQGVPEEKIWMSFERKMSCAVGKCGHCRIDETYVCLDGPVFNYTKAKQLID